MTCRDFTVAYINAIVSKDLKKISEFIDPEVRGIINGTRFESKEWLLNTLSGMMNKYGQISFRNLEIVADVERNMSVFTGDVTAAATVPEDNNLYKSIVDVFHWKDGKIKYVLAYNIDTPLPELVEGSRSTETESGAG